ncbi:MAG: ribonuclease P protein component [Parcubacteria group bacterium]|jgi:ribonuclease P protein component
MLPTPHRLKGKKVFNDIFRLGKTFSNDVLLMKIVSGEKDQPAKFGFAASLKFSKKAVERNKAKRWMREAVRARIKEVQLGKEVVFLINPKFPKEKLSLKLIQESIKKLLKQAKIL